MATYDQALSPRLGQRVPKEVPTVPVVANAAALPSNPFPGQMVFQKDINQLVTYDGTAWQGNDPWHTVGAAGEPAFTAGTSWASESANRPVRFQRVGNRVFFSGSALWTPAGANAPSGSVIFTLPTTHRPLRDAVMPATGPNGSAVTTGYVLYIPVGTGQVTIANGLIRTAYLDGLSFPID